MSNKGKVANRSLLLFGIGSFLWFIFRTGTKPSRIVYPCQRAALANSSALLLSASIPLSLTVALAKTERFFSKKGGALALLIVLSIAAITIEPFGRILQPAEAANPNQEIKLALGPKNATLFPASDLYVLSGRAYAHISNLIDLMGLHGLLFYKSNTSGVNKGPSGLIARNDVVLVKINAQWGERGGTNTDVLKELIQAVVNHPDGFVGEIVVGENTQEYRENWPQSDQNNAEDHSQSVQDVINTFSPPYRVSTSLWDSNRTRRVQEYSANDMTSGYVVNNTADPDTGLRVSYPKFQTLFGTYVSFKYGIWNGTGYEKRLKIIDLPVLKSHSYYGVTASVKLYMGVQSEQDNGGLTNGHSTVGSGGMGTMIVQTGLPTLSIIDAIWVNANPPPSEINGPATQYASATRLNVLMASTDPVALDYWASKHVLLQAAQLIGYTTDPDTHTLNPDSNDKTGLEPGGEAFGVWLNRTRNVILAAGYTVTTDEKHMNVYARTQTILGDVDRDGKVNVADLFKLGKAYGSDPSEPNWDPYCNFNSDNAIDKPDLSDLSKNFGKINP
jgi:hypothetical protein